MFHRLPDRIRAHVQICFIALVLHRVMRMRLKAAGSKTSPERALELLRQLQRHRVHLPDDQTVTGLSTIATEQAQLFTYPACRRSAGTRGQSRHGACKC